jgi:hypothetical protein
MIELTMHLFDTKGKPLDEIPFILASVPGQTPDNADVFIDPYVNKDGSGELKWGQWRCISPYLGKKAIGRYFYKNLITSCTVEQSWNGMCYQGPLNPVGYFFDMEETNPFLILGAFNPMHPRDRVEWGQLKVYPVGLQDHVEWKQN